MQYKWALLVAVAFTLPACDPSVEAPVPDRGAVDFSNYIAVGNSFTAGVSNGGLYRESQMNSFPAILVSQFRQIEKVDFKQPLLPGYGSGYLYVADYDQTGNPVIEKNERSPYFYEKTCDDYNNLGIPGIRVRDIADETYGEAGTNPFFYRIIPEGKELTMNYLEMVADSNPSFFTVWMGGNDVLDYALSGGEFGEDGQRGTGLNGITNPAEFSSLYKQLVAALTKDGAKGVVASLPVMTHAPFFTMIPYNAMHLDQIAAEQANAAHTAYNEGLVTAQQAGLISAREKQERKINFSAGSNAIIIEDETLTDLSESGLPSWRHLRSDELVLYSAREVLSTLANPKDPGSVIGLGAPLPERYELTTEEIAIMTKTLTAYNDIIRNIVSDYPEVALVNIGSVVENMAEGAFIGGSGIDNDYISEGMFSLDGIHFTSRGYARIANAFIDKINKEFEATINPVIVNRYVGIKLP